MSNETSYLKEIALNTSEIVRLSLGGRGSPGDGSVSSSNESLYSNCQNAADLRKVITYADAGDRDNERITTIVCSSATLGISFTDTYSYAGSAGNYRVSQITRISNSSGNGSVSSSNESLYSNCQNAADLRKVITYADAGDRDNERITTIVCSSATLGISFTDTYSYAGSAGNYRVSQITRTT